MGHRGQADYIPQNSLSACLFRMGHKGDSCRQKGSSSQSVVHSCWCWLTNSPCLWEAAAEPAATLPSPLYSFSLFWLLSLVCMSSSVIKGFDFGRILSSPKQKARAYRVSALLCFGVPAFLPAWSSTLGCEDSSLIDTVLPPHRLYNPVPCDGHERKCEQVKWEKAFKAEGVAWTTWKWKVGVITTGTLLVLTNQNKCWPKRWPIRMKQGPQGAWLCLLQLLDYGDYLRSLGGSCGCQGIWRVYQRCSLTN